MNRYIRRMPSPQIYLPRNSEQVVLSFNMRLISRSLGPVEPDTVEKVVVEITDEEKARQERISNRPPLDEILNLHDFEVRFANLDPTSVTIVRRTLPSKSSLKRRGLTIPGGREVYPVVSESFLNVL